MVVTITGTAHPPPSKHRENIADFNAAEIATTDLSRMAIPVLVEHEGHTRGKILSSWEGTKGELRVMARVTDKDAELKLRSGELPELSLGTSVFAVGADVCHKRVQEVSLVEKGARQNCIIDSIDGQQVRTLVQASKRRQPGACHYKYR
jgi:hypothetical protein